MRNSTDEAQEDIARLYSFHQNVFSVKTTLSVSDALSIAHVLMQYYLLGVLLSPFQSKSNLYPLPPSILTAVRILTSSCIYSGHE